MNRIEIYGKLALGALSVLAFWAFYLQALVS